MGRGGLLFRLLVPSRCGEGLALLFPLCCSGSRLIYMERALPCAPFQPSGVPKKRGLGCACVLCLPSSSGSGSQELDVCTLPRCSAPSPLCGPSPSPHPRWSGACAWVQLWPSWRMSTKQNLRRSLIRNWRPVCSAVGDAVFGAEPAPFPSPLPPASGRAGLARSQLGPLDLLGPFVLRRAGSVFGPVNFLSLFCCPTF